MTLLKPFRAHFEYSFKGKFKDHFDDLLWPRLFSKSPELNTKIVVHNHSSNFDIPYIKKGTKIDLDFNQIHSVSPEKIKESDYHQSVEFKFNSKPVEVIQIVKDDITFSNEKSEVYTVSLDQNLLLIRD